MVLHAADATSMPAGGCHTRYVCPYIDDLATATITDTTYTDYTFIGDYQGLFNDQGGQFEPHQRGSGPVNYERYTEVGTIFDVVKGVYGDTLQECCRACARSTYCYEWHWLKNPRLAGENANVQCYLLEKNGGLGTSGSFKTPYAGDAATQVANSASYPLSFVEGLCNGTALAHRRRSHTPCLCLRCTFRNLSFHAFLPSAFPCPRLPLPAPPPCPRLAFPCPPIPRPRAYPCPRLPFPRLPCPPLPLPAPSLAIAFPCPRLPLTAPSSARAYPFPSPAFPCPPPSPNIFFHLTVLTFPCPHLPLPSPSPALIFPCLPSLRSSYRALAVFSPGIQLSSAAQSPPLFHWNLPEYNSPCHCPHLSLPTCTHGSQLMAWVPPLCCRPKPSPSLPCNLPHMATLSISPSPFSPTHLCAPAYLCLPSRMAHARMAVSLRAGLALSAAAQF
ncbi:unnamed protein product, partial [Closterium sp. NIES-65]